MCHCRPSLARRRREHVGGQTTGVDDVSASSAHDGKALRAGKHYARTQTGDGDTGSRPTGILIRSAVRAHDRCEIPQVMTVVRCAGQAKVHPHHPDVGAREAGSKTRSVRAPARRAFSPARSR